MPIAPSNKSSIFLKSEKSGQWLWVDEKKIDGDEVSKPGKLHSHLCSYILQSTMLVVSARCSCRTPRIFPKMVVRCFSGEENKRLETQKDWMHFQLHRAELKSLSAPSQVSFENGYLTDHERTSQDIF